MWKPLPSRRVLKTLRGSPKGKERGQYLLAVGLGRYKWYQSQTPGDVPARRLFPEGGRHDVGCASKDAGPRRWVDLVGSHIDWRKERVPTRILGPEGEWIVRSHIGWEENQTPFIRV